MEATGSACKRRWLQCCHLSMPPLQPAACAGPACVQHAHSMSLQSAFCHHEQAKKKEYDKRVCKVVHSVFTPLCCLQLEVLAMKLPLSINTWQISSAPNNKHYCNVISWLRCHLSIAILRSANMCVRGSCSSRHCPRCEVNITLASSEGLPM